MCIAIGDVFAVQYNTVNNAYHVKKLSPLLDVSPSYFPKFALLIFHCSFSPSFLYLNFLLSFYKFFLLNIPPACFPKFSLVIFLLLFSPKFSLVNVPPFYFPNFALLNIPPAYFTKFSLLIFLLHFSKFSPLNILPAYF